MNSRVIIDLNSVDEDGETIVFLDDVVGPIPEVGRLITAYEPDDGVAAPARVSSIHPERGVAFLQVDWTAMKPEAHQGGFRLDTRGWVTSSTAASATATRASSHSNRIGVRINSSRSVTAIGH